MRIGDQLCEEPGRISDEYIWCARVPAAPGGYNGERLTVSYVREDGLAGISSASFRYRSPCDAGQFRVGDNCEDCPRDSFRLDTDPNEERCIPCADPGSGRDFVMITNGTQSKGPEECVCPAGYYELRQGKSKRVCKQCGAYAECASIGVTLESLHLRRGYWRYRVDTEDFRQCPGNGTCIGGRGANDDLCAEHHTGPFCELCDDGYFIGFSGRCEACGVGNTAGVGYLFLLFAAFAGAVLGSVILAVIVFGGSYHACVHHLHCGNMFSACATASTASGWWTATKAAASEWFSSLSWRRSTVNDLLFRRMWTCALRPCFIFVQLTLTIERVYSIRYPDGFSETLSRFRLIALDQVQPNFGCWGVLYGTALRTVCLLPVIVVSPLSIFKIALELHRQWTLRAGPPGGPPAGARAAGAPTGAPAGAGVPEWHVPRRLVLVSVRAYLMAMLVLPAAMSLSTSAFNVENVDIYAQPQALYLKSNYAVEVPHDSEDFAMVFIGLYLLAPTILMLYNAILFAPRSIKDLTCVQHVGRVARVVDTNTGGWPWWAKHTWAFVKTLARFALEVIHETNHRVGTGYSKTWWEPAEVTRAALLSGVVMLVVRQPVTDLAHSRDEGQYASAIASAWQLAAAAGVQMLFTVICALAEPSPLWAGNASLIFTHTCTAILLVTILMVHLTSLMDGVSTRFFGLTGAIWGETMQWVFLAGVVVPIIAALRVFVLEMDALHTRRRLLARSKWDVEEHSEKAVKIFATSVAVAAHEELLRQELKLVFPHLQVLSNSQPEQSAGTVHAHIIILSSTFTLQSLPAGMVDCVSRSNSRVILLLADGLLDDKFAPGSAEMQVYSLLTSLCHDQSPITWHDGDFLGVTLATLYAHLASPGGGPRGRVPVITEKVNFDQLYPKRWPESYVEYDAKQSLRTSYAGAVNNDNLPRGADLTFGLQQIPLLTSSQTLCLQVQLFRQDSFGHCAVIQKEQLFPTIANVGILPTPFFPSNTGIDRQSVQHYELWQDIGFYAIQPGTHVQVDASCCDNNRIRTTMQFLSTYLGDQGGAGLLCVTCTHPVNVCVCPSPSVGRDTLLANAANNMPRLLRQDTELYLLTWPRLQNVRRRLGELEWAAHAARGAQAVTAVCFFDCPQHKSLHVDHESLALCCRILRGTPGTSALLDLQPDVAIVSSATLRNTIYRFRQWHHWLIRRVRYGKPTAVNPVPICLLGDNVVDALGKVEVVELVSQCVRTRTFCLYPSSPRQQGQGQPSPASTPSASSAAASCRPGDGSNPSPSPVATVTIEMSSADGLPPVSGPAALHPVAEPILAPAPAGGDSLSPAPAAASAPQSSPAATLLASGVASAPAAEHRV